MELNSQVLEMKKQNIPRVRCYHVYSQRQSQSQKGFICKYYADDSTKLVIDCAKYLSAPERSYLDIAGRNMLVKNCYQNDTEILYFYELTPDDDNHKCI